MQITLKREHCTIRDGRCNGWMDRYGDKWTDKQHHTITHAYWHISHQQTASNGINLMHDHTHTQCS